jgi:hypothetical protein
MKKLMDENLYSAIDDFDVGAKAIYSRHKGSSIERVLKPDALLTPFLYAYNCSMNRRVNTYIGDLPMLVYREQMAK